MAALAAGAHGVIVEVHPDPDHALSDGAQSLDLTTFARLAEKIRSGEPRTAGCDYGVPILPTTVMRFLSRMMSSLKLSLPS
jgi:hypothetical protein